MEVARGRNRIGEVFERASGAFLLLLLIDDDELAAKVPQQELGDRQVEPGDHGRSGHHQAPGGLGQKSVKALTFRSKSRSALPHDPLHLPASCMAKFRTNPQLLFEIRFFGSGVDPRVDHGSERFNR
jgi:hypothetical protein